MRFFMQHVSLELVCMFCQEQGIVYIQKLATQTTNLRLQGECFYSKNHK